MVLMVLDHVRDFVGDRPYGATDLERTTVALFLTRWMTHFCAPVFVFLAGTGAYLAGTRGKDRSELARFLWTRGLWLIVLELTVVRFGMTFRLDPTRGLMQVIWAIGWSMIALAALIRLPTTWVATIGLLMIAGHNLLDGIRAEMFGAHGPLKGLWHILHEPGRIAPLPGTRFFIVYPLVPWIGVMATGFAFGGLLRLEPARRRRALVQLGSALTAAFLLLRAGNFYGDPGPWHVQPRGPVFTILSFLNCEKYPPSLLYLLMTLGPAILVLGALDRGVGRLGQPLVTLGRVPLFFYLLQWPLAHALAIALVAVRGEPPDEGHGLPVVYLVWLAAMTILYPLCAQFAALKRRRRDAWLNYL